MYVFMYVCISSVIKEWCSNFRKH